MARGDYDILALSGAAEHLEALKTQARVRVFTDSRFHTTQLIIVCTAEPVLKSQDPQPLCETGHSAHITELPHL